MIRQAQPFGTTANTGAVTICLPQDVQGEAWDYPLSFFARRVHHIERRPPDPQRLAQARALGLVLAAVACPLLAACLRSEH